MKIEVKNPNNLPTIKYSELEDLQKDLKTITEENLEKLKNSIKKYKSKKYLIDQYLNKRRNIYQIAKLCNCGKETIRYWLIKLDIPRRCYNEAIHLANGNHCNLSEKAKQWIDGELLGDGCLYSRNFYSANLKYGSKHLEYINYVVDVLTSFGIKQAGKINQQKDKRFNCYTYTYASLCYEELLAIYKRWYPNGKKIVPKDLKLTPLVCRQWYIGDGHLHKQSRVNGMLNGRPNISLATCGFTISDVNWLTKQLNKIGLKATRRIFNNIIGISAYSTKDFLDYIGNSPVECYKYKWDYDKEN